MKRLLFFIISLCFLQVSFAQNDKIDQAKDVKKMEAAKDQKEGWSKAGGLALGLDILNFINPRVGAGDNIFRLSGAINYSANLLRGKQLWNNKFGFLVGAQKIGDDAFTKSADAIVATSQYGYQVDKAGKWYVAALADLQTQFLPTYGLNYFVNNPVNEPKPQTLSGKFFAPANLKLAPGVIYKPNANWTFMYSPVGIKAVIVSDDILKRSGIFFPVDSANLDRSVDFQVGSQLRIDYINKFLNDRLVYGSTLDLYSNYRRNPENVDIEWFNSLDFLITKNIALSLKSDWFYDDDILVFVGGDANRKGKRPFIRNFVGLKYNTTF